MKLKQVQAIHPHPRQRDSDRRLNHAATHWPRARNPFGKCLDRGCRFGATASSKLATERADKVFGGTVVISEVPGRESGVVILNHLRNRSRRLDVAVTA